MTRDLAAFFEVGVGLDPGEEMIRTAKILCQESEVIREKVRFAVCGAEECARGVRDVLSKFGQEFDDGEDREGTVDLLTAAMAVFPSFTFEAYVFWL